MEVPDPQLGFFDNIKRRLGFSQIQPPADPLEKLKTNMRASARTTSAQAKELIAKASALRTSLRNRLAVGASGVGNNELLSKTVVMVEQAHSIKGSREIINFADSIQRSISRLCALRAPPSPKDVRAAKEIIGSLNETIGSLIIAAEYLSDQKERVASN